MPRKHFIESLERVTDYQKEYEKLESLCGEEYCNQVAFYYTSINSWISDNFRSWKKRKNYCSYSELREQLGFPSKKIRNDQYERAKGIDINKYLLYCEMILNIIFDFSKTHDEPCLHDVVVILIDTIKYTIARAGLELQTVDGELIIIKKNAVAIEVSNTAPEIADVVLEYDHYLLKGDIERKKELLSVWSTTH